MRVELRTAQESSVVALQLFSLTFHQLHVVGEYSHSNNSHQWEKLYENPSTTLNFHHSYLILISSIHPTRCYASPKSSTRTMLSRRESGNAISFGLIFASVRYVSSCSRSHIGSLAYELIAKICSGCMQEINHSLLNEMKFSITRKLENL